MEKVRTRFAPSPTGYMHIGNLRAALFAYLVAKSNDGQFILRIEDTDQNRYVDGAVEFIYNIFKTFHIDVDEGPFTGGEFGPYIQSERLDLYRKYADMLVEKGEAYYCFCTEDRLSELREIASLNKVPFMYDGHCKTLTKEECEERIKNGEAYVIRQRMPKEGVTTYDDVVYGEISIENKFLEDQILIKSDGYPTYNFANVIDDHLMNITHVTRGVEYLSSTPKYILLYEAFGWKAPVYIHMPHVTKADGSKISKRNKDDNVMDLIHDGYLPEAIINYLAFIGWSPEDNVEIMSMDELLTKFDIHRINNSSGSYDVMKLRWFNAHYIKELPFQHLLSITKPHLEEAYDLSGKTNEWLEHLIRIYQNHISYGKEIVEVTDLFFRDEIVLNDECSEFLKQDGIDEVLASFYDEVLVMEDFCVENINLAISNVKLKTGIKGKMLFMPIRIKVSGQMHGPELGDTIYLLGKDTVLNRLKQR